MGASQTAALGWVDVIMLHTLLQQGTTTQFVFTLQMLMMWLEGMELLVSLWIHEI